jgi:hypothetical protein
MPFLQGHHNIQKKTIDAVYTVTLPTVEQEAKNKQKEIPR